MLNSSPKVSVVIPVYGVEKYIEKCAISLFRQTLHDIEYIFVNDCTKDSSIEVLLDVIERFPNRKNRISIINHEVNMGLPAARRTGVLAAKGDFVIHCDSDDWISDDLYEKMYQSISISNADVAICDIICTDGVTITSKKQGTNTLDLNSFLHDVVRMKSSWSLVNKMFRRTLYSEDIIFPTAYMGEDMALCLQLLSACHNLTYINDSYYYYLTNLQSESRKEDKETIIRLYDMFSHNFNIVLSHFYKNNLFKNYGEDLSYVCFLNKLMFAKRVKSISFIKRKTCSLPSTSISLFSDKSIPVSLRIQSLLFWLLKL